MGFSHKLKTAPRPAWVPGLMFLLFIAFATLNVSAGMTTTFIGGGIPNQTDFNQGNNWTLGLPGVNDTAVIDYSVSTIVPAVSADISVSVLQVIHSGRLQFSSTVATLTCGSAVFNNSMVTNAGLGGGNLLITGTASVDGTCIFSCATTINGVLTVNSGAFDLTFPGTMTIANATVTTVNGPLIVEGLTTLTINGTTTINGTLNETGSAGGTIAGTGSLTVNGALNVTGTMNVNLPTFITTAATTTTITPGAVAGAGAISAANGTTCAFNGPISMNQGTLSLNVTTIINLNNSVAFGNSKINGDGNGTVNLASGATLTSTNSTAAKNTITPIFNNLGTTTVSSGSLELDAGGTSSGTINATTGGPFIVNSNFGQPFVFSGSAVVNGALEVDSGSYKINMPFAYTGSLAFNGGTVAGTGSLTVNGPITVSGTGSTSLPTLTVPSGQTLTLNSNATLNIQSSPSGSLVCNGTLVMKDNSYLNIASGSTATCAGVVTLVNNANVNGSGNFMLTSTGMITSNVAVNQNQLSCNTFNAGSIISQTGVLNVSASGGSNYTQTGGSLTLAGGGVAGTLNLNGGVLNGSGTIAGNVVNAATVAPGTPAAAGALSITGNFTQMGAGTLALKLGGTAAGAFDTVTVGNTAALAGSLAVSEINSFTLPANARFDVLTYASKTGAFPTVTGSGFTVDSTTSATKTTLVANVPNPVPAISALGPSSAAPGGGGFSMLVTGTGFLSGISTIQWNGAPRTTTFVSPTQLIAAILASDIASAGSAAVTVINSAPGGGTSAAVTFTIAAGGGGGGGGGGNTPQQPFLPSLPFATPNPATAGQPVTLVSVAGSLSGNPLSYAWDFGDGSTGTGATVTHVYATGGVFTATVTVSDMNLTSTASVNVGVNAAPDNNVLTVQKASIKFSFAQTNADMLKISGTLAGVTSVTTAKIQIGNYVHTFSSKDKNAKFALKFGKFALLIQKASLYQQLKDLGFPNTTIGKPGAVVSVPLFLTLDNVIVIDDFDVTYTSKAGSSGTGTK